MLTGMADVRLELDGHNIKHRRDLNVKHKSLKSCADVRNAGDKLTKALHAHTTADSLQAD